MAIKFHSNIAFQAPFCYCWYFPFPWLSSFFFATFPFFAANWIDGTKKKEAEYCIDNFGQQIVWDWRAVGAAEWNEKRQGWVEELLIDIWYWSFQDH